MAELPGPEDLIGWPADQAFRLLTERGAKVEIRLTTTSRRTRWSDASYRVVRQRQLGPGQVELVVAPFPTVSPAGTEA
ncbi:MAG: hypothetical protein ACPLRW_11375 [Moorellales bacterium]